jgi:hypothetical protein
MKLRNGRFVREGSKTSLTEPRLRKTSASARQRWDALCGCSAVFVVDPFTRPRSSARRPKALADGSGTPPASGHLRSTLRLVLTLALTEVHFGKSSMV